MDEVKLALTAELLNVSSERLVEGRRLTASKMIAKITQDGVTLNGDAALDNVPMRATWVQSFEKQAAKTRQSHRQCSTERQKSAPVWH